VSESTSYRGGRGPPPRWAAEQTQNQALRFT
jgi:hypothetical protein